jgi:hypothetical protein
MFNYLTDNNFVEYVLEMEKIPFLVRGSLGCSADFNFRSVPEIRITGPTYRVSAVRENSKDPNDKSQIHIQELFEEVVFQGEIDLPEKTRVGVFRALNALERWADLLCLAIGNPKIIVEVQRPVNIVMASPYDFDLSSFASWGRLTGSFLKLEPNE